MNRLVMVSGTVLAFAFAVALQEGCSSSTAAGGSPASSGGSGNASSGGSGNATASGGTSAGSTSLSGSGGSPTSGGMSSGGSGGTPAGGVSNAGSGGTPASGGATAGGTGGTSAAGTGGGSAGTGSAPMPCDTTVVKGGPCTTAGAACAKTCGVNKLGYKVETCGTPTPGVYGEGLCTYPSSVDLACYKETLPLVACAGVASPAGPLAGKDVCTVADCMPCGPNYQDSNGPKVGGGACVCTGGKWQCASAKEWPPQ